MLELLEKITEDASDIKAFCERDLIVSKPKKARKNKVNEIEKIYVEEGVYGKRFTRQLIDFIGFVLNRYSGENSFPDDMVHFTYLRVMERLGAIMPEKPKLIEPVLSEEDELKNKKELDKWALAGKTCLFDPSRSNLGNYIFSIARNAHSNYTYHTAKKFKELKPPATEIPEPEITYDFNEELKLSVLTLENKNLEYFPENIRRFLLWQQNN